MRTTLKSANTTANTARGRFDPYGTAVANIQSVQDGTSHLDISKDGRAERPPFTKGSNSPKRSRAEITKDPEPPAQQKKENRRNPKPTRTGGVGRKASDDARPLQRNIADLCTLGSSRNRKTDPPVDPDFDRSLGQNFASPRDVDGEARTKRLFNPDRDDAKTFNPQNPPGGDNSKLQSDPHARRARKDPLSKQQIRPSGIAQSPKPVQINSPVQRNDAAGRDVPPSPISPLDDESEERLKMIRQPETRPITPEQLISEVKGIYAGLIMVEQKCSEVDSKQHRAASGFPPMAYIRRPCLVSDKYNCTTIVTANIISTITGT